MASPNPLQFFFLGTCTSTGAPLVPCLTNTAQLPFIERTVKLPTPATLPPDYQPTKGQYNPNGNYPLNVQCPCCRSAVDPDVPEGWKNKRGNTGAVLRKRDEMGKWKNVLLDVGKTFRSQAETYFPRWGVQTIDAILLTHGHADAYFGLDDLREWNVRQGGEIPIYLNQATFEQVAASFPYLVDSSKASGGGDVPHLAFHIIDDYSTFEVFGIRIQSFPVHHGVYFGKQAESVNGEKSDGSGLEYEPLICLGFLFDDAIAYLSDVSGVPAKTWEVLLHRPTHPTLTAAAEHELDAKLAKLETTGKSPALPVPVARIQPTAPPTPSTPDLGQQAAVNGFHPSPFSAMRLQRGTHIPSVPPNRAVASLPPIPTDFHLPPLKCLIIDALFPTGLHGSHFSFGEAVTLANVLQPDVTYMLGFTHPVSHYMWEELCRSILHEDGQRDHPDKKVSEELVQMVWARDFGAPGGPGEVARQQGRRIMPAYDGLALELDENGGPLRLLDV